MRYRPDEPELVAGRARCRELTERFNAGEDVALFGAVGEGTLVERPVRCDYGTNVSIGARSFVNFNAVFLDPAPITIGDDVQIASNVQLITATHPLDPVDRASGWELAFPITIEDGAWLGAGVVVLPGRTVGREAVVGAGAVVTKDVPPRTVVAGNPARVIRRL
ncbi:MAG: sugar O-acetyltransferase [Actinomycetota bacterium]|nr:sugar O-acetyltransferase [Actinomycetota bacterium]